jgi:hypothetical protein
VQAPPPLLLDRALESGDYTQEASDEEEGETFLGTLKFRADPETVGAPPGARMGGRPGSLVADHASPNYNSGGGAPLATA